MYVFYLSGELIVAVEVGRVYLKKELPVFEIILPYFFTLERASPFFQLKTHRGIDEAFEEFYLRRIFKASGKPKRFKCLVGIIKTLLFEAVKKFSYLYLLHHQAPSYFFSNSLVLLLKRCNGNREILLCTR